MSTEIHAVRMKVNRAAEHFEHFKSALGVGRNPKGRPHASGIHLQRDGRLHYSSDAPEPRLEDCLILGDAIHQLRSSLDHLACALVRRHHDPAVCEKEKILFPIYKQPNDWRADKRISQNILEPLIGTDELTAIEDAQPYKRNPANPLVDDLYILSKLDNIDKHRTILVVNQTVRVAGTVEHQGVVTRFNSGKQKVKPGTQVLDLGIALPQPPFGVQVDDLSPFVVFTETDGVCDDLSVFPLFRRMESTVRQTIAAFVRFF